MNGSFIAALWTAFRRVLGNPWHALAALLALAALALFGAQRLAVHQRDRARAELVHERDGRKADRAAYARAEQAAAVLAERQRDAAEIRYRQQAERADTNALATLDRARTRAAGYVAAQRLRVAQPGCTSSRPPTPAESDSAEGADRPSPATVILSREDFDIMVENTARLEAAREWALGHDQQTE